MKKYRGFIITLILSAFLGGIIGFLSGNDITLEINLGENIYLYLFKILISVEVILSFIGIMIYVFLMRKFKSIDLDYIPKVVDNVINILINISTVAIIVSLVLLSIMLSKNHNIEHKTTYIMISTIAIFVSTILQIFSIRCYNHYYPDRKLNMFEDNSDKKYFNKLDEGEKWVIYNASYKNFKGMQMVYSIIIIIIAMLSPFITIPIILPLVIALLWIIQVSLYTISISKYN